MESIIKHEIAFFDFIRGWAAIFVFFHHAAILGGGPSLFAGHLGQEAVNAFMLASGFLIYYQCSISKSYDGFRTIRGFHSFYIRRFFRIAPAYYVSLIVALSISAFLGESREAIAEILPSSATSMDRYYINDYLANFIMHVSFIFGMIPDYAFSTPLPDWSLGLEMQFYFIFPFLFIFLRRNFILFFLILLVTMLLIYQYLSFLSIKFPMPSFLPLKFHNFAAGMALSHLYLNKESSRNWVIVCITLTFLTIGNKTSIIPALFVFGWWYLVLDGKNVRKVKIYADLLFKHKSSKALADISYSVYITHLMIMLPYFAFTLKRIDVTLINWLLNSLLLFAIVSIISYTVYRYIELPGINLGKTIIDSRRNLARE